MRRHGATVVVLLTACLLPGGVVGTIAQDDVAVVPQPFSATLKCTDRHTTPTYEREEIQLGPELHVRRLRTPTWSIFVQASDPDLTGEGSVAMNGDLYWSGPSIKEGTAIADVLTLTIRFGSDNGSWAGTRYLYHDGDAEIFPTDVIRLDGDGSFQGRTALASMTIGNSFCSARLTGVLFRHGPPEAPGAPVDSPG